MIKDTSIPMPEVRRGVETALPVLRAGNGTMVYCKAGINRSPMMACCILIASGHSAEEAMALVKERRPVANPYHPTYRKHISSLNSSGKSGRPIIPTEAD